MKTDRENRRTRVLYFCPDDAGRNDRQVLRTGFPPFTFANYEMIKLLGYDTYEEFSKPLTERLSIRSTDDREQVALDIGPEYYAGLEYATTYRMPRKDGRWFWTLDKGKVVEAEDGRLAIISACGYLENHDGTAAADGTQCHACTSK